MKLREVVQGAGDFQDYLFDLAVAEFAGMDGVEVEQVSIGTAARSSFGIPSDIDKLTVLKVPNVTSSEDVNVNFLMTVSRKDLLEKSIQAWARREFDDNVLGLRLASLKSAEGFYLYPYLA